MYHHSMFSQWSSLWHLLTFKLLDRSIGKKIWIWWNTAQLLYSPSSRLGFKYNLRSWHSIVPNDTTVETCLTTNLIPTVKIMARYKWWAQCSIHNLLRAMSWRLFKGNLLELFHKMIRIDKLATIHTENCTNHLNWSSSWDRPILMQINSKIKKKKISFLASKRLALTMALKVGEYLRKSQNRLMFRLGKFKKLKRR